jgi:hypothetical protein
LFIAERRSQSQQVDVWHCVLLTSHKTSWHSDWLDTLTAICTSSMLCMNTHRVVPTLNSLLCSTSCSSTSCSPAFFQVLTATHLAVHPPCDCHPFPWPQHQQTFFQLFMYVCGAAGGGVDVADIT